MKQNFPIISSQAVVTGHARTIQETRAISDQGLDTIIDRAFDETTICSEGAQDEIAYIDGDSKLRFKTHKGKYIDHNVDCIRTYIPGSCAVYKGKLQKTN